MTIQPVAGPLVLDAEDRCDRDHHDGDQREGAHPPRAHSAAPARATGSLDAAQGAREAAPVGRARLVERFGHTQHAHVERVELRGPRGEVGLGAGELRLQFGQALLGRTQQCLDRVAIPLSRGERRPFGLEGGTRGRERGGRLLDVRRSLGGLHA